MEVEGEAEAHGFLHQFLSRFSAACRQDAESRQQEQQLHATEVLAVNPGVLLVRIAGEILLYGSTHLAQVKKSFAVLLLLYVLDSIWSL